MLQVKQDCTRLEKEKSYITYFRNEFRQAYFYDTSGNNNETSILKAG